MSDVPEIVESDKEPASKFGRWLFYLGAAALLFAMAVEALAVLGRHIGVPLWGSIELVQAGILIASSTAILSATLADKHARVRILTDRISGSFRMWLQRVQALFCALFFCALTGGSVWIYLDLRGGYEESELLHIPYAPLRILCIVVVLGIALTFIRRMKKGDPS
jgi:TRAP-type C4-dicarboxylate transport system permease small subunit